MANPVVDIRDSGRSTASIHDVRALSDNNCHSWTSATTADLYGHEKQMENILGLQVVLRKIEEDLREQKDKIKTLPSDRVKGTGRKSE